MCAISISSSAYGRLSLFTTALHQIRSYDVWLTPISWSLPVFLWPGKLHSCDSQGWFESYRPQPASAQNYRFQFPPFGAPWGLVFPPNVACHGCRVWPHKRTHCTCDGVVAGACSPVHTTPSLALLLGQPGPAAMMVVSEEGSARPPRGRRLKGGFGSGCQSGYWRLE